MQTAAKIMRKKRFIKEELDRKLPGARSDALWGMAQQRLDEILRRFADMPAGEHMHTDNYIFPAAALYLTLKEEEPQIALSVLESASVRVSTDAGKKLAALMRIPFMRSLFIWIWDPMTRRMFSERTGFQNVFYEKKKGEYRMDVIACPYCKYFAALGCPELTRIFCANDDRCYGSLPGLEFRRTGTLGTGADRCDFYIRKV